MDTSVRISRKFHLRCPLAEFDFQEIAEFKFATATGRDKPCKGCMSLCQAGYAEEGRMRPISRRKFGKTVLSGMIASSAPARAISSEGSTLKRPNILFICSDQHSGPMMMGGPGDVVPVRTPTLKRLASMGVDFKNTYCVDPVCTPSRASLMTGRFASDVGSYCNSTPFDGRVPTWGNYLQQAGYFCWAAGKMDLTPKADLGFTQVHTSHGHYDHPDITSLFRRPMCYRVDELVQIDGKVEERGKHDQGVLQAGLEFLRTEAKTVGKPWVAYLGFTMPHPPFGAPQKYWDLYPSDQVRMPNVPPGYLEKLPLEFQVLRNFKMISTPVPEERVRRARSAYYGMITELDGMIGRLLDELERTGQLKSTLVVYTSDHGEMLGEHGLWLKNNLMEGAARVPLVMAGAGLPRGMSVEAPVSHVDLVATLLDFAGVAPPVGLRGHSLLPMTRGAQASHPGFVYAESNSEGNCTGSFMIRKGDWKYIYFSWYGDKLLFNLKVDPGEMNNLVDNPAHASTVQELHSLLTSLVDPDVVTEAAFRKQHQVLTELVQQGTPEEFFRTLRGRLGRGQAVALTRKYYPKWQPGPSSSDTP
jgi:choline-sulfatase